MSDLFDRAQDLEALQRERALAAQAQCLPQGPTRMQCEDCGEAIPLKRRQAMPGCRRCLACQQQHECRR